MTTEVSSVPNADGSFTVQRVVDGQVQFVKETTTDSGEVENPTDEMETVQTITIIRRIGAKITF